MALQAFPLAQMVFMLACELCTGGQKVELPADHMKFKLKELFTRETTQDWDELQSYLAESVQKAVRYIENQSQAEILVHTRLKNQDMLLLFINETIEKKCPIEAEIYANFMTLSHLPVIVMATLLPELFENNFVLSDNFTGSSAYETLKGFKNSLDHFEITKDFSTTQKETAVQITTLVSAFVNSTLFEPNTVNRRTIQRFVGQIKPQLSKAAIFAVEDYFSILNGLSCLNIGMGIVIAVEGFSHTGSFLEQYYTDFIETQFGSNETYSPRRIAFMPQLTCNSSSTDGHAMDIQALRMVLSDAAFSSSISNLFELSGSFPLHSLLSEAASEILGTGPSSSPLTFKGFTSFEERLYIILIVALFSIATVFAVVVISICCEDKFIRMDDKKTNLKIEARKEGPSLLTPIPDKKFSNSYASFHKLKKRHMLGKGTSKTRTLLADQETNQLGYTCLSDSGSPATGNPALNDSVREDGVVAANAVVTQCEITLADKT